jgi:Holliday junction resolvasome RuvABC endonuclease subunit
MSKNNFCAIDASTNSLAFAHFVNGVLTNYGKIRYSGRDIYEKIGDTAHKTQGFFKAYPAESIIIEQTIYANSPKTAANLAMSQGALVGAAKVAGVRDVHSVSPMEWQNYIGNKRLTTDEKAKIKSATPGRSASWYKTQERAFRKGRTIKFVNERYGLSIGDDDVADAIALGTFALENWEKATK